MATLTMLVSFNGANGQNPSGDLFADANGNLIGTTTLGGADDAGTVFEIAKTASGYANTPTTLVNFNFINGDNPNGGLLADASGNLFGTTNGGGSFAGGFGVVFELTKTATGYASASTTLAVFGGDAPQGIGPQGSLIADAKGNLFGTTFSGGANRDKGTVFEVAKTATGYASTPTTLVSFNGSNGSNPFGSLIFDASGNLFGTTEEGGANNFGTVFEIVKTATGYASAPTALVNFNGPNGAGPEGSLIADAGGNLFGTTDQGGAAGEGTVFEIVKTATGYANTPTTLVSFTGSTGDPAGSLIADAAGDLFGTASGGGANGGGTVFEIVRTTTGYASTPIVVANFASATGSLPIGSLIADASGNLFGTTNEGGPNGDGAAFEITGSGFVTSPIPCFRRGTRVLSERGEVAVEDLRVGERVVTLSGACKPVVWIGMGRDLVTRANKLARPVIVRQGALADGVPHRDLYLTHGHALYLDGALIPVENLVNHRTILWDERTQVVEYYHIELEDHDVLLAEGAPAESYYDAGNRASFQNARPGSAAGRARPTFAPVLNRGKIVERVWARLFDRASGRIATETTGDPDLHLVVDGVRLDPAAVEDGVFAFALQAAPNETLLLRSRRGVPSLLGQSRRDHRPLGVTIRQIVLHHAGIATRFDYDQPQLREGGCYPPEDGFCWTDGEFALPARFFIGLRGPLALLVCTEPRTSTRYPLRPARAQAA